MAPSTLTFNHVVSSDEELVEILGRPGHRVRDKVVSALDEHCTKFIARAPFVVVASYDANGRLDLSPKGDPAGFVVLLDKHTLAIPHRPGNRREDTFHNVFGIRNPDQSASVRQGGGGGEAVGYVLEMENGFKIYHTGDTNVFGDMALIRELHKPDLALVCIGGFFTMGPEEAAYAVRELIKPKAVIPIHYGTFPVVNRTPAEFKKALGPTDIRVLDVAPGQAMKF